MTSSQFAGLGIKVDKPARMVIIHPVTREPLRFAGAPDANEPAWIDLLSNSSAVAKAHDRIMNDRQLRLAQSRKRLTSEEIDADALDKIVKLTQGWELADLEGLPLLIPFTPEAARELYEMPELSWLRGQVMEFVTDLGNFHRTPGKTSGSSPNTSSGSTAAA